MSFSYWTACVVGPAIINMGCYHPAPPRHRHVHVCASSCYSNNHQVKKRIKRKLSLETYSYIQLGIIHYKIIYMYMYTVHSQNYHHSITHTLTVHVVVFQHCSTILRSHWSYHNNKRMLGQQHKHLILSMNFFNPSKNSLSVCRQYYSKSGNVWSTFSFLHVYEYWVVNIIHWAGNPHIPGPQHLPSSWFLSLTFIPSQPQLHVSCVNSAWWRKVLKLYITNSQESIQFFALKLVSKSCMVYSLPISSLNSQCTSITTLLQQT